MIIMILIKGVAVLNYYYMIYHKFNDIIFSKMTVFHLSPVQVGVYWLISTKYNLQLSFANMCLQLPFSLH